MMLFIDPSVYLLGAVIGGWTVLSVWTALLLGWAINIGKERERNERVRRLIKLGR